MNEREIRKSADFARNYGAPIPSVPDNHVAGDFSPLYGPDEMTYEEVAYVGRLTHALVFGLSVEDAEEWAEDPDSPELTPAYLENLEEAKGYQGAEMDAIYDETIRTQGYWAE